MIEPTLVNYIFAFAIPYALITIVNKNNAKLFMTGVIFNMGMTMFMQDVIGMDRYLIKAEEQWINYSPIVGLIIAAFAVYMYFKVSKKVREHITNLIRE
jgi:hypothetical protein